MSYVYHVKEIKLQVQTSIAKELLEQFLKKKNL